jgi:hypothetical protein
MGYSRFALTEWRAGGDAAISRQIARTERFQQTQNVAENPSFGDLALGNPEKSGAGVGNFSLRGSDAQDLAFMRSGVFQARYDLIVFGDDRFVQMRIGITT